MVVVVPPVFETRSRSTPDASSCTPKRGAVAPGNEEQLHPEKEEQVRPGRSSCTPLHGRSSCTPLHGRNASPWRRRGVSAPLSED
eukprot:scaffold121_cov356-Pavlova_lutheri.AAC.14